MEAYVVYVLGKYPKDLIESSEDFYLSRLAVSDKVGNKTLLSPAYDGEGEEIGKYAVSMPELTLNGGSKYIESPRLTSLTTAVSHSESTPGYSLADIVLSLVFHEESISNDNFVWKFTSDDICDSTFNSRNSFYQPSSANITYSFSTYDLANNCSL